MRKELAKAIEMRKKGQQKESNELLMELAKEVPNDAVINYQCAWSLDMLGEESKAVPYYENAIKVFYSMTLYNLQEYGRAMELLLNTLIDTTKDEEISSYNKAISFYSDKLDQTWK